MLPLFGQVSSSKEGVPTKAHAIQNLTIDDRVFFIMQAENGCVPASFVRHVADEAQVNLEIVWKSAYNYN